MRRSYILNYDIHWLSLSDRATPWGCRDRSQWRKCIPGSGFAYRKYQKSLRPPRPRASFSCRPFWIRCSRSNTGEWNSPSNECKPLKCQRVLSSLGKKQGNDELSRPLHVSHPLQSAILPPPFYLAFTRKELPQALRSNATVLLPSFPSKILIARAKYMEIGRGAGFTIETLTKHFWDRSLPFL